MNGTGREALATQDGPSPASGQTSILAPGDTCWRIEHADRAALIVDAQDYFRLAKAAMLKARRSIILIGWDFDTRIELEPGRKTLPGPNKLGRFLTWLAWKHRGVEVFVLKWDLGFLENMPRGSTPLFILDWMTSRRVHFRLDGSHPTAAAHHQKITVIDDSLAFCGGIDMTVGRWDTRRHREDDKRRRTPRGSPSKPWHDATLAFDGAAARALGEIARERWTRATGHPTEALSAESDPWPDELAPTFTDIDLGIARTWPEREGEGAGLRDRGPDPRGDRQRARTRSTSNRSISPRAASPRRWWRGCRSRSRRRSSSCCLRGPTAGSRSRRWTRPAPGSSASSAPATRAAASRPSIP